MFRHVRDIIGDDIAAFLARIREAQGIKAPATVGDDARVVAVAQEAAAPSQHADAIEVSCAQERLAA